MTITTRLLDAADAARFQTVRLRAVDTAPTSFLHVFCEDGGPKDQVAAGEPAAPAAATKEPAVKRRRRGHTPAIANTRSLGKLRMAVAPTD